MQPILALRSLVLVTLLTSCSHSDPAGAGKSYLGDAPFLDTEPVQLTFSPSIEGRPYYSPGGTWLAYAAGRGTAARQDLCLAVLPGSGGQQRMLHCADDPDQTNRVEAVEHAAINDAGRIAFVRHVGLSGGVGSIDAGLFITGLGETDPPRRLMQLGEFKPGSQGRWDYLQGMTWTGEDEITAMVTTVNIGEQCEFCPIDTLYIGGDIVRIRTDLATPTYTVVGPSNGASRMAIDPTTRQIYLLHGNTISTMAPGGGAAEVFHVPPPVTGTISDTVSSIAAGGGRVYYARHTRWQTGSGIDETHAIYRVDSPSSATIVFLSGTVRVHDYITASGDGRRIAFEGVSSGSRNIYWIEVNP
jgi:hypothetical protein